MHTTESGELALGVAVDQYFASRPRSNWPVSLSDAVRAVRLVSKVPDLTDAELGSLIAVVAVSKGHNVMFDLAGAVQPAAVEDGRLAG